MNTDNYNKLKIASLQAENIMRIYAKKSFFTRFAIFFSLQRKQVKHSIKRYIKRLFRKNMQKKQQLMILIHIRGGIGDVAMTRIFIKKLRDALPNSHITLSYDSKNVVELIFGGNVPLIDEFINKNKYFKDDYDIVLSGCHVFVYKYLDMKRAEYLAPDFIPTLKRGMEMSRLFKVIDDNTPYLDGYLANITVPLGYARVSNLGLSTGLDVKQNDKAPLDINTMQKQVVLERFGLSNKKYITVHNGVSDFTNTKNGYLTRSWPVENWNGFAKLFKQTYPDIMIVQIGSIKSKIFDFADYCLVGKTALSDLPYILSGSTLHIDSESGMVQLANLLEVTSVVLFGPTPLKYFAYDKNINIVSQKCSNCMCIEKQWMTKCIMGYDEHDGCMASIKPESVFTAVKKYLLK